MCGEIGAIKRRSHVVVSFGAIAVIDCETWGERKVEGEFLSSWDVQVCAWESFNGRASRKKLSFSEKIQARCPLRLGL